MFTLKKLLGSVILCAALTVPSQASAPDEGTSTNSTSLTQNLTAIADAKAFNEDYALMSLTLDPLQQVCQILAENDCASTITSLGQVSIHLAARILRRMGAYDNPNSRNAIRVDLRKAIKAREAHIASQSPKGEEEKKPMLEPWKALLGENASVQHLIWANDMLSPANIERLGKESLLTQLMAMSDKTKALALGASAAEIFTDKLYSWHQACIIDAALKSSCPASEYAALGTSCKEHLFTEEMDEFGQSRIIQAALLLSRPLSECAALGFACKEHLFTEKMDKHYQETIILAVLPLSDAQLTQLVSECAERPEDNGLQRFVFIDSRSWELMS